MERDISTLPEDPHQLKHYIATLQLHHAEQLQTYQTQLHEQHQLVQHQDQQIAQLREQINLLLAKRFGPASERHSPDQLGLFNEAEVSEQEANEAGSVGDESEAIEVPAHRRRRGKRAPLPSHLPREEVIHDLPEAQKVCAHDGTTLTCIGEDTSEQLDIVPARIKVIVHRRKKYACPCCQQNVVSAPLPAQPIPKAQASAGLLAFIAVSKYLDHLPLYRQAQQWQRLDVAFSRATLANWMIKCGHLVQPLINLLHEHLLGYDLLHMDETRVQVLKEPNKVPSSQSYMWVMKGGPPGQSALLFHYDPSRGQAVPERLLAGYRGILQTDGYEGYGVVQNLDAIRAMGCWAHARRKFDEVIKAQGKTKKGTRKTGKADQALAYIRTLYRIEREAAELDSQQRHAMRQAQAKPVLEQLRNWLDRSLPQVPPQSTLGKALHYLHNQWPKLITYLEDGRIPLDNNAVERAIRPFAIGRKNWLFSNSQAGATASANLYSVLQTAKDNDLDPFDYLKHIFTHLPQAKTVEQIEALLPWNARALNG